MAVHHEILQFFSNLLLLQSLSNRLDVCIQGSSFLLFEVIQFFFQICLRIKEDLFFWQNGSGVILLCFCKPVIPFFHEFLYFSDIMFEMNFCDSVIP